MRASWTQRALVVSRQTLRVVAFSVSSCPTHRQRQRQKNRVSVMRRIVIEHLRAQPHEKTFQKSGKIRVVPSQWKAWRSKLAVGGCFLRVSFAHLMFFNLPPCCFPQTPKTQHPSSARYTGTLQALCSAPDSGECVRQDLCM